jgi:hypothetical protein
MVRGIFVVGIWIRLRSWIRKKLCRYQQMRVRGADIRRQEQFDVCTGASPA